MKNFNKVLCLILALVMAVGMLAGCGSSGTAASSGSDASAAASDATQAKTVKLRVGIGAAADSALGQGVEYFGKLLDEKSGGLIQVELCAGSVLGGDRETIEGVGLGTFEMCNIATGPIANFSASFLPLDLPYVVTDRQTAYSVLDGENGPRSSRYPRIHRHLRDELLGARLP